MLIWKANVGMQRFGKFLIIPGLFLFTILFIAGENTKALIVNNRSLSLASVTASAVTRHTIGFNFQTTNSVGSLKFEYCTSPLEALSCVAPAGLNSSTATLTAQSGETGFSIFSQNTNTLVLGRVAAVTGTQANSYTLNNVTNPSSIGSFYLRITSFASSNGTGPTLDFGGTVGVITKGVAITSEVPPVLEFCVGSSIPALCDSASGSFLNLGNFSTGSTSPGTTQFMVGTNANFGYVVRVQGNTMTSGNNTIPAISSPTGSQIGQSQFGINLRANTVPAVGADPSGGSGTPSTNYNSPNIFKFADSDIIASNASVSDIEKYTISYIVNVKSDQPLGIYNTTLTYVATATF
jgi:hypothetical protein